MRSNALLREERRVSSGAGFVAGVSSELVIARSSLVCHARRRVPWGWLGAKISASYSLIGTNYTH